VGPEVGRGAGRKSRARESAYRQVGHAGGQVWSIRGNFHRSGRLHSGLVSAAEEPNMLVTLQQGGWG